MNELKVIVFDFDGVILESVPIKNEAFYKLFLPYGEKMAIEALKFHKKNPGMYRSDKIRLIFQEVISENPEEPKIEEMKSQFFQIVKEKMKTASWVPGSYEFISSEKKWPLYVVSASPQEELRVLVKERGMAIFFSDAYGGPKKKTQLLKDIFALENCDASEILFIGDRESDRKAADAVGCRFLGRVSKEENLFSERVDILPDMKGLKKFISDNFLI